MEKQQKEVLIQRLKESVEATIMFICIVIIAMCIVYMYIVQPVKSPRVKSTIEVGYQKFKSVPVVDTTGTYPEPDTLIDLGYGVTTKTYKQTFE